MGVTLAVALACLPPDPLDDLARFVDLDVITANKQFADEHVAWVKGQQATRPERQQAEWDGWLADAEACRDAWALLAIAADPQVWCSCEGEAGEGSGWHDNPDFRRERLAALRELLGEADYAAGRMPPPVPVWHFSRP